MPELPEVERFRKYINDTSMHQTIENALLSDEDLLKDVTANELIPTLKNNEFISTNRHGKFVFIQLHHGGYLVLHFGMTGDLKYYKFDPRKPRPYLLLIRFTNGYHLSFTDPRKFGEISFVNSPEDFIEKRGYGPDALLITEGEFIKRVQAKKSAIKTVLIDQHVVAGIGNEFSDEILFQSQLHPESKANKLSTKQVKIIYQETQEILKEAVSKNADRKQLLQYFFLENRKAGLQCPSCKGKTAMKTIGGRSAYFCEECQELVE